MKRQWHIALERQSERLYRITPAHWAAAWRRATDAHYPRRGPLYDIYRQTLADGHTTGCARQRRAAVMAKRWHITDPEGNCIEQDEETFKAEWFFRFAEYVLDSRLWGHSLIEIGPPTQHGPQWVELIPRRHVVPEKKIITHHPDGDQDNAITYADHMEWLVEAGDPDDLGLLLMVAPNVISKRILSQYWDKHAEVFGMPIRIARTDSLNDEDYHQLAEDLKNMGANCWGVFDKNTEIQSIESSGMAGAVDLYKSRIDICNAEISKILLGQTMTVDNGSSLSQSQTHKEILDMVAEEDARFLRFIINGRLMPILQREGMASPGSRFEWDNSVIYTQEQMQAVEQMILQRYEIEPDYFYDKYRIRVTPPEPQNPEPQNPGPQNPEPQNPEPAQSKTEDTLPPRGHTGGTRRNDDIETHRAAYLQYLRDLDAAAGYPPQ